MFPVHVLVEIAKADPGGFAHETFVRHHKAYRALIKNEDGLRAELADTSAAPVRVPCGVCGGLTWTTGVYATIATGRYHSTINLDFVDPLAHEMLIHTHQLFPFRCCNCQLCVAFICGVPCTHGVGMPISFRFFDITMPTISLDEGLRHIGWLRRDRMEKLERVRESKTWRKVIFELSELEVRNKKRKERPGKTYIIQ